MIVRYDFPKVVIRREVKTKCLKCGKKLKRVLSDQYFRNGFHDERKTRAKMEKQLDKKAKALTKQGTLCGKCEQVG